ncbi:MAG: hypothetical protein RBR08_09950 [Desulforegulaceae bacterium]|nr:hypothetical protein [Desulforegulaceae bacterium]
MKLKTKKQFVPFLILIILLSFNIIYAWELPEEVIVRNTYPPQKWQIEKRPATIEGDYSIYRYYLYASTGKNQNLFRNVIVWKKDDKFCVKILRLNFSPDTLPTDCLEPIDENNIRKKIYDRLNSSDSVR